MKKRVTRKAIKELQRIPSPHKERITSAIDRLPEGDTRPMVGLSGVLRLRVGVYRIIFKRDNEELLIIRIGHGREIYRHK